MKTPKIHFLDTGLLANQLGLDFHQLKLNQSKFESLLKNFVLTEILKLMTGSSKRLNIYHYRNNSKYEVDVVLREKIGTIAGVKVKSGSSIGLSDFNGLQSLLKMHKGQFVFGEFVLYNGDQIRYYGDKLAAVPISALWT